MVLQDFRKEIDEIDSQIIQLLSDRIRVSEKVGKFKKENKLEVTDTSRETEVYDRLKAASSEKELDHELIFSIWECIMQMSKNRQKKLN